MFCLGASAWAAPMSPDFSNPLPQVHRAWVDLSQDAFVQIELPATEQELKVVVRDAHGEKLATRFWADGVHDAIARIPTRGWTAGTYTIHIQTGQKHLVRMLMVRE